MKWSPRTLKFWLKFDNPSENDFTVGKDIDKYDARRPKTKNVVHEFESIENTRSPLGDNPITNDLMQEVWDEFGPSTKYPEGDLFPSEIPSTDPITGKLRGIHLEESIIQPLC